MKETREAKLYLLDTRLCLYLFQPTFDIIYDVPTVILRLIDRVNVSNLKNLLLSSLGQLGFGETQTEYLNNRPICKLKTTNSYNMMTKDTNIMHNVLCYVGSRENLGKITQPASVVSQEWFSIYQLPFLVRSSQGGGLAGYHIQEVIWQFKTLLRKPEAESGMLRILSET